MEPGLSLEEAAHVLGMLPWQAELVLGQTRYALTDVERIAQVRYQPAAHQYDRFSYCVTTGQAAKILGVHPRT
jgi:hypothetical protein